MEAFMTRRYIKSVDRKVVGWVKRGLIYVAVYEDE
jgi:hypothetical protein